MHLIKWVTVALVVVIATIYFGRAFASRNALPLNAEHRVRFASEFRADQEAQTDWQQYVDRERDIAREARDAIGRREVDADVLDRHASGSVSNPDGHAENWNRSRVLYASSPRGAAVLLHGLSDSPYSVRATAELFQSSGYSSFVPRMPGHGFAVGDLRHATWQDWLAVTRIAMRAAHRQRADGQPLVLAGYSNGGLLAIRYALDCASQTDTPCPDAILLLSPAIEVTPFARFGRWHGAVSWMQYFERFAWDAVLPEVDPYKFTSFPKNPAREIAKAAAELGEAMQGDLSDLPPIIAFQSAVDDTVSTEGVIDMFARLPKNGSELVLYDVNRSNRVAKLMTQAPPDILQAVRDAQPVDFSITVLSNVSASSLAVAAWRFDPAAREPRRTGIDAQWPASVFSLSHIAIPFRPDDPVYGRGSKDGSLSLGDVTPKGERKVLSLSPNYFARLRHNPFYVWQSREIARWLNEREAAR